MSTNRSSMEANVNFTFCAYSQESFGNNVVLQMPILVFRKAVLSLILYTESKQKIWVLSE